MFKAACICLSAMRVDSNENVDAANKPVLNGYKRPMTKKEIKEEAMVLCLKEFPIEDGWSNHDVNIIGFDPDTFAQDVNKAQITLPNNKNK